MARALLDADGIPVAGDDDGGGLLDALISAYELRADGLYTAVMRAECGLACAEIADS